MNPGARSGASIAAEVRRALAEGEARIAAAKAELRPRRKPSGIELPPPDDLPSPDAMVASILAQLARGRLATAGLGLIKLREWFDANGGVPEDERTWDRYVAKHLPDLGAARADELAGRILYRGGILRCIRCGVRSACRCGCGASYAPTEGWAAEAPTAAPSARERAIAALEAHPDRSDRAIAADIGVGKETVRRARAALAQASGGWATRGPPSSRLGRDGKRYRRRA